MKFDLKIFIPSDELYRDTEIEAKNLYEAKKIGNFIFREEFQKSGKKNGNFIIEQK